MRKTATLFWFSLLLSWLPISNARATSALRFEENKTQWHADVRYRVAVPGGVVWLRNAGFTYCWVNAQDVARVTTANHSKGPGAKPAPVGLSAIRAHAVQVDFEGATPKTLPLGQHADEAYSNYFFGNDPRRWASRVHSYKEVTYASLYPGVDLRVYSTEKGQFEYDLMLVPGADPARIRLRYRGATRLQVLPNGTLTLTTSVGEVHEQQPVAYQLTTDGQRQPVPCRYQLTGTTVSFVLPAGYDARRPLVIDPVVQAATYVGIPNRDGEALARASTYDAQGNLYVAGVEASNSAAPTQYPVTPGAYTVAGSALTLTKFNPTGTARLYSTHFGGTQTLGAPTQEEVSHLVCDAAGNLFLSGSTTATDFPTLATSYDRTVAGMDVFVTKLSPTGDALLASTYLGGSGNESAFVTGDLRVDAGGAVYVAGRTQTAAGQPANDFPTTPGAYIGTAPVGLRSFIAHLDPQLTTLRWSTFTSRSPLGDEVRALRVAPITGQVYFAAWTLDATLTVGAGAASSVFSQGYIGCLSATGTQRVAATFLPGTPTIGPTPVVRPELLDLDAAGNVYVAGQGFLVTPTAGTYVGPTATGTAGGNGFQRLFMSKLTAGLTGISQTALLAGGDQDNVHLLSLGVDACGNAVVSASTYVDVFPIRNPLPNGQQVTSFYVAALSSDFRQLLFGSYYGSPGGASYPGFTAATDPQGRVYVAINARNYLGLYPTLPTAYQPTPLPGMLSGSDDIVGLIIDPQFVSGPPRAAFATSASCTSSTVQLLGTSTNAGTSIWDFGDGSPLDSGRTALTHTYAVPGLYRVRLRVRPPVGACQSRPDTTSRLVNAGAAPQRVLPATATLCPGAPLTLDAGNPGSTYSWNTGATTRTIAVTAASTYFVAIRNPCGRTDTVRVSVAPVPRLERDSTACAASVTLRLAGAAAGSTYQWSTGETSASIVVREPNLYSVTVSNSGCTFTLRTTAAPSGTLTVPNIFTPNGDTRNEAFTVLGLPAGTQLSVYNRWGRLVYRSTDYRNDWTAADQPTGFYYYLLENARFCQGNQVKGWVEVQR